MPAVYWLLRLVVRRLLRWRLRLAVTGERHVPARGAVIVAANHRSLLDFLVLGAAVDRRLTFLVAAEYFERPAIRRILRFFGSIPTERRRTDPSAVGTIRKALRVLARGEALAVFPEGWATSDGLPPRPGIGLLAAHSGAHVVPAAIVGTDRVLPRGSRRPHRHPVAVHIGPPRTLARQAGKGGYAAFSEHVMRQIDALRGKGPESPRG